MMPQACHNWAQIFQLDNLWTKNFEGSIFRGKHLCENFGISVDCLRIGDDVHNNKYFLFWIVTKGLKTQSDRGNT